MWPVLGVLDSQRWAAVLSFIRAAESFIAAAVAAAGDLFLRRLRKSAPEQYCAHHAVLRSAAILQPACPESRFEPESV